MFPCCHYQADICSEGALRRRQHCCRRRCCYRCHRCHRCYRCYRCHRRRCRDVKETSCLRRRRRWYYRLDEESRVTSAHAGQTRRTFPFLGAASIAVVDASHRRERKRRRSEGGENLSLSIARKKNPPLFLSTMKAIVQTMRQILI